MNNAPRYPDPRPIPWNTACKQPNIRCVYSYVSFVGISATVTIAVSTNAKSLIFPATRHLSDASAVIGISIFVLLQFPNFNHTSWFNPRFLIWIPFSEFGLSHKRVSLKTEKWNHGIFKNLVTETEFGREHSGFSKDGEGWLIIATTLRQN